MCFHSIADVKKHMVCVGIQILCLPAEITEIHGVRVTHGHVEKIHPAPRCVLIAGVCDRSRIYLRLIRQIFSQLRFRDDGRSEK